MISAKRTLSKPREACSSSGAVSCGGTLHECSWWSSPGGVPMRTRRSFVVGATVMVLTGVSTGAGAGGECDDGVARCQRVGAGLGQNSAREELLWTSQRKGKRVR